MEILFPWDYLKVGAYCCSFDQTLEADLEIEKEIRVTREVDIMLPDDFVCDHTATLIWHHPFSLPYLKFMIRHAYLQNITSMWCPHGNPQGKLATP